MGFGDRIGADPAQEDWATDFLMSGTERKAAKDKRSIINTFSRDFIPETTCTRDAGTARREEKYLTIATLAALSTGGAAILVLRAPL